MSVTAAFIEQALKDDRCGAHLLGVRWGRQRIAQKIARRPLVLPVKAAHPPNQLVGWIARDSHGNLTFYVLPQHRGRDANQNPKNDLGRLLANLTSNHPGKTRAIVMPWNPRSKRAIKEHALHHYLATIFIL